MSLIHFPVGALSGTFASALAPGRAAERRRIGGSIAATSVAVAAFVAVSLVLSYLVTSSLGLVGVIAGGMTQIVVYLATAGLAMLVSRRFTDLFFATYRGRWVVYAFLAIDLALVGLTAASRRLEVDLLGSIAQMAALCFFAYLQFWNWRGSAAERAEA